LEGRTGGFDIRRKLEVGPKGKLENKATGESRGSGSKVKLDDAISGASWKSVGR
jgi:hypothetical protein